MLFVYDATDAADDDDGHPRMNKESSPHPLCKDTFFAVFYVCLG